MNIYVVRIFLKNNPLVTELMFNDAAKAKLVEFDTPAKPVTDDYGHTLLVAYDEIVALDFVDLSAEIRGQTEVTFMRQMSQDKLEDRVRRAREGVGSLIRHPANTRSSMILEN